MVAKNNKISATYLKYKKPRYARLFVGRGEKEERGKKRK